MKNLSGLLILLLLGSYGCARYDYDKLEKIPEYPQPARVFDTSAVIEFTPDANEELNLAILDAFRTHGYNNLAFNNRFRPADRKNSKVVTPLSFTGKTLECESGRYFETQIIVLVRDPGVVWNNKLYYTPPRYFQAYSQIRLQGDYVLDLMERSELQKAVRNLFTIEEFREALEPSGKTGISMPRTALLPDADGCWEISKQYQSGNGDWHEAGKWALWALEKGNRKAADYFFKNYLHNNFIGENKLYASTLKKIAGLGHPEAQYEYARLFAGGSMIPKDQAAALFWMEKAAGQEHSGAQYELGTYYENGIGVPKDLAKALFWYRKAADRGSKEAAEKLNFLED